jgi:histidine triad (HIT) family protein
VPSIQKAPRTAPCIFCEIVAGRVPASLIAENALSIAFLTIGPLREGHTLVIPRRHAVTLTDPTPEELAAMFQLGAEIARRQRLFLGSEGETLFLASGEAGEQSVFHLHLHVVPRSSTDGLNLTAWWEARLNKTSRTDLDAIAARLRGDLAGTSRAHC